MTMSNYERKCQTDYEIATDRLWEELNRECSMEYICELEGKSPDDCEIECWIKEGMDHGCE